MIRRVASSSRSTPPLVSEAIAACAPSGAIAMPRGSGPVPARHCSSPVAASYAITARSAIAVTSSVRRSGASATPYGSTGVGQSRTISSSRPMRTTAMRLPRRSATYASRLAGSKTSRPAPRPIAMYAVLRASASVRIRLPLSSSMTSAPPPTAAIREPARCAALAAAVRVPPTGVPSRPKPLVLAHLPTQFPGAGRACASSSGRATGAPSLTPAASSDPARGRAALPCTTVCACAAGGRARARPGRPIWPMFPHAGAPQLSRSGCAVGPGAHARVGIRQNRIRDMTPRTAKAPDC